MDKHTELELKFDASGISRDQFINWGMAFLPVSYERVKGPDIYWRQGNNTVRHRWSGGAGEMTVKSRRSTHSTTNRLEIDLRFASDTTSMDVEAFLLASGWKQEFVLFKECDIFRFLDFEDGCGVDVVYYTVGKLKEDKLIDKRSFIEIEIEKGSDLNSTRCHQVLEGWASAARDSFGSRLLKPMNKSLYEIFSGKKTKVKK